MALGNGNDFSTDREKDTVRELKEKVRILEEDLDAARLALLDRNAAVAPGSCSETEERLRLVVESARVGTWDYDLISGEVVWDRNSRDLFGVPAEGPLTYSLVLSCIHYEDRREVENAIKEALEPASGGTYEKEFRVQWPDGSIHWVLGKGKVLYAGKGIDRHPVRFIGINHDLTEHRLAEKNLEEVAEAYRLALEGADLGTWDMDLKKKVYSGDERCRHLFGVPETETLSAARVLQAIHPDDRERVLQAVMRARDPSSDGRYEAEYRTIWPDGSVHWVHARGQAFFAGEGAQRRPVRFTGTVMEITERKQIEQSLDESETRFRTNFENASVGMAQVSLDGYFLRVNQKLCDITGYPEEELLSRTFMEITHPDDVEADVEHARLLRDGKIDSYQMEKRYIRRDGDSIWISLTVGLQRDRDGTPLYYLPVMVDITDRKRAEEALLGAKEDAEAANGAKSEFLANMSHELRTPMTVIMGAVQHLLLSSPGPGQREFLEMADRSSHRLLAIIDDLLDISRIEAKKLKIEDQPFDLRLCLCQSTEIFMRQAMEKGIRLYCEVDPETPEQIIGDTQRLEQILVNLIGNAVKFTDRGEIAVRVHTTEEQVTISVRDTGIGIPADKMELLFEPFTQVDSSRTRRFGGTGLGLAICRKLVAMMGGVIRATSEEGKGSTFSFTLPLKPVLLKEEPHPERGEEVHRPLRVLLAEDDAMVRDLVNLMLSRLEVVVSIAENGRQAVDLWREGGADLILMDLQMPEMDGIEATRRIRELEGGREPKTCIFALTAHARREDREECMAAGMDGFMTKPLRMAELRSLIENCPCGAKSGA